MRLGHWLAIGFMIGFQIIVAYGNAYLQIAASIVLLAGCIAGEFLSHD